MERYKHLADDQKRQILDEYLRTKNTRSVADSMGLQIQRVISILKSQGFEMTRLHETACHKKHDLVVQMANDGATLSDIARAVGTNHHRVREYLERMEIPYDPWTRDLAGNPHWKGGKTVDKSGYILVKIPDHPYANNHGYVREHRLVVEKMIGRYLLPKETVHHIDRNRQNNAPENLRYYATNADHLADTITGQVPNWSEQGKSNIREGVRRSATTRRKSNPSGSTRDDFL